MFNETCASFVAAPVPLVGLRRRFLCFLELARGTAGVRPPERE